MAAAAASQLFGGTPRQIEYSAEMGLEHHLPAYLRSGVRTCADPLHRAHCLCCRPRSGCQPLFGFSDGRHSVSFDRIVEVMKQTGHDLPSLYKETAKGGLAVIK